MYAKLFTSIYQGTLRGNSHGLLVFTNMLAHCDKAGHCDIHPRAIAEEVGLTIEQVKAAIDELESPDDESRSPEENGRRIIRLDEHRAWGWLVVNYVKYRSIRDEEDRREQNRKAQDAWRLRKQNKPASADVSQDKPQSAHTEAYTDTEKKERARASRLPTSWELPEDLRRWAKEARPELNPDAVASDFRDYWIAVPGTKGTKLDWPATWRKWVRNTNAPKGSRVAAVTVPSKEADKTKDYLESQELSEAERVASDEARRRALSAVKRVA